MPKPTAPKVPAAPKLNEADLERAKFDATMADANLLEAQCNFGSEGAADTPTCVSAARWSHNHGCAVVWLYCTEHMHELNEFMTRPDTMCVCGKCRLVLETSVAWEPL